MFKNLRFAEYIVSVLEAAEIQSLSDQKWALYFMFFNVVNNKNSTQCNFCSYMTKQL